MVKLRRRHRRVVPTCYFRHRWGRWSWVKFDESPGSYPEIDEFSQFRMCRRCGHQQLRDVVECV